MLVRFSASVIASGGRTVAVQPTWQIVRPISAYVTAGLSAPGVQRYARRGFAFAPVAVSARAAAATSSKRPALHGRVRTCSVKLIACRKFSTSGQAVASRRELPHVDHATRAGIGSARIASRFPLRKPTGSEVCNSGGCRITRSSFVTSHVGSGWNSATVLAWISTAPSGPGT
jgi:hypothetical protein